MVIKAFVYYYYISMCEEWHKGCGGGDSTTVQQWDVLQIKKNLPSKHNTKQYGFPTFPSQNVNSIIVKKLLQTPHTTQ
jgi:hypothetical protein